MKTNTVVLIKVILSVIIVLPSAFASESNKEVLQRVWDIGSQKFCEKTKQSAFDKNAFDGIIKALKGSDDRTELGRVLNPFLSSLGWSHTEFMSEASESYYLFKSHTAMVNSKAPPAPKIINPGVQLERDQNGYFVREVLDGFPAKAAGLTKSDRIISLDGNNFSGDWGKGPRKVNVEIDRQGQKQNITVEVKALNWSQTFQDASQNSINIFTRPGGKKIGYVRLWSGVHPKSADLLQKAVAKFKKAKVDGVILDLRGGYGGAWWDHLDPFFADTGNYYSAEMQSPDGKTNVLKSPFKKNKKAYLGPMVVLINEGVRSGKEALAYQFKKTKRARLVGQNTPGYFSTGQNFFADEPKDYILYLCVFKIKLDGVQIEGVGIAPDDLVPFSASGEFGDSQLNFALGLFQENNI